ncbi:MAG: hypothetical protein MUE65_05100 [Methanomassiliicoccales archaeon]|jgi:hypothetical protein|nr:hypothetical protein [Methanomassiliicoccales archaeon]
MSYKVSERVCLQTPDIEDARAHFVGTGMTVVSETPDSVELVGDGVQLFIDRGEKLGPIMELLVPDLDMARDDLLTQGWELVAWEGRGGRCYMSNPMGLLFNLWEDPSAYEEGESDGS